MCEKYIFLLMFIIFDMYNVYFYKRIAQYYINVYLKKKCCIIFRSMALIVAVLIIIFKYMNMLLNNFTIYITYVKIDIVFLDSHSMCCCNLLDRGCYASMFAKTK